MSVNQTVSQQAIRVEAEQSTDPRVDLAVQRTELALERTQLAWVRTTFSLYTGGIALDKGMAALHEARVLRGDNWVHSGHGAGILLAVLGTALSVLTTYLYYRRAQELAAIKGTPLAFMLPAGWLSFVAAVLGTLLTMLMVSGA